MTQIITDIVNPLELTAFARTLPTPSVFNLETIALPRKDSPNNEYAIDVTITTREVAKYRAMDTETPIGKRPVTLQRTIGVIPPLGQKTQLTESDMYELLKIRNQSGPSADPNLDAIYNDVRTNVNAVVARSELARGQVLTTGMFTLAENGLAVTADFGIPSSHLVAPGTAWSDHDNSTPLDDLDAWLQLYLDDTGELPTSIITTRRTITHLRRNKQVRTALYPALAAAPSVVDVNQLDAVLNGLGIPPLIAYDSRVSVDGTFTRVIPEGSVIFVPEDKTKLGHSVYGVTPEVLSGMGGSGNPMLKASDQPGVVAVALEEFDPVSIWTKAASLFVPVLNEPTFSFVATVWTP